MDIFYRMNSMEKFIGNCIDEMDGKRYDTYKGGESV